MSAAVDVVIVGAGLSGLAAARVLSRSGLECAVFEASDAVGGRVRTDVVDGYRLDRGFQVLDTGYPELRNVADLGALDLGRFTRGAKIREGDALHTVADPFLHPTRGRAALAADVGSLADKVRLGALAARDAVTPSAALCLADDRTSYDELRRWGVSDRMIDAFVRPFFAGVFLENELATSSRLMHLLLQSMARGWQAVPALGMQALPEQLASALPIGTVWLDTRIASVAADGVVLDDGTRVGARAVVVATEPAAAAVLLPGLEIPRMHAVTTLYHSAAHTPLDEPTIVLDLDRPDVCTNTLVVTEAAPTYAPAGRALVQTSIVGVAPDDIEPAVRERLAQVYGTDTREWDHLATYTIREALPDFPPYSPFSKPARVGAGLYICGDHRATPSQQGALISGRRAARAVLQDLRRAPV